MSLKFYERVGYTGNIVEATEVNWKNSDDTTNYYLSPVIRPTEDVDQSCSFVKYHYFRVQDTARVQDGEIILVSPYKTFAYGKIIDGVAHVEYAGSNLELDPPEGSNTVKYTIAIYNDATGDRIGSGTVNKNTGELEYVGFIITINESTNLSFRTVKTGYLDINNPELGTEYGVRNPTTTMWTGVVPKRVTKTKLFYKLSSEFNAPVNTHDWDMIYAGIGNVHISVPFLDQPNTAYTTINSYYTGIDLYTPYIATQLRLGASVWDDVGNSPQWKIMLKCKIFN